MASSADNKTVKQQRSEARVAKVAAYQKERAAQQRKRRIAITSSIIGGVAVVGVLATFIATSAEPKQRPEDIQIAGLQEFNNLPSTHVGPDPVDYEAEYDMKPPAGGDHFQAWLNCGIYDQPQQNEHAVHSLEHGAVWVTYNPELLSDDEVAQLRASVPELYTIVSPYPGLETPIAVSAWGAQITLDDPSDARIDQFVDKYWKSAAAPEPGASCMGAIEGPGRVI